MMKFLWKHMKSQFVALFHQEELKNSSLEMKYYKLYI